MKVSEFNILKIRNTESFARSYSIILHHFSMPKKRKRKKEKREKEMHGKRS